MKYLLLWIARVCIFLFLIINILIERPIKYVRLLCVFLWHLNLRKTKAVAEGLMKFDIVLFFLLGPVGYVIILVTRQDNLTDYFLENLGL